MTNVTLQYGVEHSSMNQKPLETRLKLFTKGITIKFSGILEYYPWTYKRERALDSLPNSPLEGRCKQRTSV